MPSVDLTGRLILNRCDNPADFIVIPLLWGSQTSWPLLDGENRAYADGTLRVFVAGDATGPTILDTWEPTLGRLTAAQTLGLRARIGVPHFARDAVGQRIPCWLKDAKAPWMGPYRGASVSAAPQLVLERTDWPESV